MPLSIEAPYLLFLGDCRDLLEAKTALGLRDWCPERCLGVYGLHEDVVNLGLPRLSPTEAVARGAKSLVIGVANHGGRLPDAWIPALLTALDAGLDVVNGLHTRLNTVAPLVGRALAIGRRLIDVRHWHPEPLPFGTGQPRPGKRLLTVGTDCMAGKKYAALAITRALHARRVNATFRATGQTGLLISGTGVAIDALPVDFLIGTVEWLTPAADPDHWDIVEGQGSLLLATSLATLGLIKGVQPDVLIMCHDPSRAFAHGTALPLPSVRDTLDLVLYFARRLKPNARCGGLCLNSSQFSDSDWHRLRAQYAADYGLPVCDPLRDGVTPLVDYFLRDDPSPPSAKATDGSPLAPF